ncbi:MAG: DNA-3-methyladenine glycosylase [Rhodothermales bacterium]
MTPDPSSQWPFDLHEAVQHLSDQDPRLASLIHRTGPVTIAPRAHEEPFEALLRSIVYQQLSGKAAGTIHGRVLHITGDPPRPEAVLALTDDELRACGLSRAKTAAVKDLALHTGRRTVPDAARLRAMENAEIIERLTQVRGIGPWTVQMYLMFGLGRPDILPTTDLGIQKGIQQLDGLPDLPKPAEVEARGAAWQPYRTIASWYLWRSVDG